MDIQKIRHLRGVFDELLQAKQIVRSCCSELKYNTPPALPRKLLSDLLCNLTDELKTKNSNEYLCAIIVLFSPQSLFGLPLTFGIRRKLACAMNLTGGAISRRVNLVTFHYAHYTDFQQNVDEIVKNIEKKIL